MTGHKQSAAYFETSPHPRHRYKYVMPRNSHYLQHQVDRRRSESNAPRPCHIVVQVANEEAGDEELD